MELFEVIEDKYRDNAKVMYLAIHIDTNFGFLISGALKDNAIFARLVAIHNPVHLKRFKDDIHLVATALRSCENGYDRIRIWSWFQGLDIEIAWYYDLYVHHQVYGSFLQDIQSFVEKNTLHTKHTLHIKK